MSEIVLYSGELDINGKNKYTIEFVCPSENDEQVLDEIITGLDYAGIFDGL